MKITPVLLLLATVASGVAVAVGPPDAGVPPPAGRVFKAMAYDVYDGDTMKVVELGSNGGCAGLHTLRMANIDAPESKMKFGPEAQKFTADWVYGHPLTVTLYNKDKYGRGVAKVCYGTSDLTKCLDYRIIAAGLAWQYTAYSKDEKLAKLQAKAKEAKKGLWADPSPEPPWEWRKNNK